VELFLNGRSLGNLPLNRDASPRRWEVGFEPGTLRAVASNGGQVVASEELRTAARPDHLLLKVENGRLTPAWDDVAYVRALVVDKDGVEVPDADALLTFSVNGPAKILTTDNGDNADHSGFDRPDRHAYEGEAIAILRATANSGQATITVTGESLRSASIEVPVGARR
jgi:beta-galactosidase